VAATGVQPEASPQAAPGAEPRSVQRGSALPENSTAADSQAGFGDEAPADIQAASPSTGETSIPAGDDSPASADTSRILPPLPTNAASGPQSGSIPDADAPRVVPLADQEIATVAARRLDQPDGETGQSAAENKNGASQAKNPAGPAAGGCFAPGATVPTGSDPATRPAFASTFAENQPRAESAEVLESARSEPAATTQPAHAALLPNASAAGLDHVTGSSSQAGVSVTSTSGEASSTGTAEPGQRPHEIANRVADLLRSGFEKGGQLRMRLEPPELGRVEVNVVAAGDGLTARVEVQSRAALKQILDHIGVLYDAIAQSGTPVGRIDVELGSWRQDGSSQEREGRSGDRPPAEREPSARRDSEGDQPGRFGDSTDGDAKRGRGRRRSPWLDRLDIEI
jgi:flagellar hook-length control protein FliK